MSAKRERKGERASLEEKGTRCLTALGARGMMLGEGVSESGEGARRREIKKKDATDAQKAKGDFQTLQSAKTRARLRISPSERVASHSRDSCIRLDASGMKKRRER